MSDFTLPDMPTLTSPRLADPLASAPDLSGRRAVVTGGGSGLGVATVRELARLGATVVIGARDVARVEQTRRLLLAQGLPADRIELAHLDLLDPDSVRTFAAGVGGAALDVLVLNAGISSVPFRLDRRGVESQLATNHLGHFGLTGHLLDALAAGTDPRVVTVSSALYTKASLDLDALSDERGYSPGRAYNRSKLANVLFAVELERRLRDSGSPVRSFAAHPGMARTPLHSTYPSAITRAVTAVLARGIGREPGPAGVGVLAAAVSPEVSPDWFWGPVGSRSAPDVRGVPFAAIATDQALRTALWETSERLTGVRFLD